MKELLRFLKKVSLRFTWVFMSPREKYRYLWSITKKMGDGGSAARYTAAISNR
jgi:hypothetical protein